jgi:hypothetical protein
MAEGTTSLSFLRRPFLVVPNGPASAAGSLWGKRLGENRPLLGHIVYSLGLLLIAIADGGASCYTPKVVVAQLVSGECPELLSRCRAYEVVMGLAWVDDSRR